MTVSATIINVPDDFLHIQEAIDNSADGDTVLLQPGIYVENLNFNGNNIVLGSLFLITGDVSFISSTIIDGNQSGPVVSFENGEDSAAVITGFTLRHGYSRNGGGIYCLHSNPVINNNIINGNSAHSGGGIYCYNSRPTINNNTICDNVAVGYAAVGGGIYISLNSFPIIINSIFWGNSATETGDEIFVYGGSPEITYYDIEGGWNGEGNIDDDPLFCGLDNYWLSDISPCVGAGENGKDIGALGVGCESADIYDEIQTLPAEPALSQNYPNPFNQSTTITFSLPEPNIVTLIVYDLFGREVQTLMNEYKQTVVHRVNLSAGSLSSGFYFYRLQIGDYSELKRMVLLK